MMETQLFPPALQAVSSQIRDVVSLGWLGWPFVVWGPHLRFFFGLLAATGVTLGGNALLGTRCWKTLSGGVVLSCYIVVIQVVFSKNVLYFACLQAFSLVSIRTLVKWHTVCFIFNFCYWFHPKHVERWNRKSVFSSIPVGHKKKVIKKVQCIAIWVWDLYLEIVNLCLIDHYEHNNIGPGHILRFASLVQPNPMGP